jgi:hypothetical protein
MLSHMNVHQPSLIQRQVLLLLPLLLPLPLLLMLLLMLLLVLLLRRVAGTKLLLYCTDYVADCRKFVYALCNMRPQRRTL